MTTVTRDEVWEMFREVARRFEKTDRKFQEPDKQFKETNRKFQETTKQFKNTDRKFKDTERLVKEVSKSIGDLGNRLDDFVQEMVRPALVNLFRERNIDVHEVHPNVFAERNGESAEIDLLVVNEQTAIAVECKSQMTIDDVNEYLNRLEKLKRLPQRPIRNRPKRQHRLDPKRRQIFSQNLVTALSTLGAIPSVRWVAAKRKPIALSERGYG